MWRVPRVRIQQQQQQVTHAVLCCALRFANSGYYSYSNNNKDRTLNTLDQSYAPATAQAPQHPTHVLRRFASAESGTTPYTVSAASNADAAVPHTFGSAPFMPEDTTTTTTQELTSRCFWIHPVQSVPAADLKRRYGYERALDKKSRFMVRGRLRRDGVVSNFFPVYFPEKGPLALDRCPLYIYQLYATRKVPSRAMAQSLNTEGAALANAKVPIERVKPSAAWRALWRHLLKCFVIVPPLVVLMDKVYTSTPLPGHFLKVPSEFYDIGWTACELRFIGRYSFADLSPLELQEVTNKIAMWVIGQRASNPNHTAGKIAGGTSTSHGMMIVRDRTGKVVNAQSGITSEGVRIYRGVTIRAVYLDAATADESKSALHNTGAVMAQVSSSPGSFSPRNDANELKTRELAEVQAGLSSPAQPLHFRVETMTRAFEFKGRKVESYKIRDASGIYLASYWEPPTLHALQDGACYEARAVQVSDFPERNNLRLFEFKPNVTQIVPMPRVETIDPADVQSTTTLPPHTNTSNINDEDPLKTMMPGRLALKIDTKGTVAAETSLWEEVKQHFGPGPYDTETQARIVAAVEATPVVISYSLRQSVIRQVRFRVQFLPSEGVTSATPALPGSNNTDGIMSSATHGPTRRNLTNLNATSSSQSKSYSVVEREEEDEGPAAMLLRVRHSRMDPELLTLLPYLDPHQPYAVLMDYSVLPLQVLHCCFDPRMRSWQDVTGATLAHLPRHRMSVLQEFCGILEAGLREWGLQLALEPCRTTHLSLLPLPSKTRSPPAAAMAAATASSALRGAGMSPSRAASPLVYGTAISASTINTTTTTANSTLRHPAPPPFPTTILVVGVIGSNSGEDAKSSLQRRVTDTVAQLGRYFATTLVQTVRDEAEVVRYMTEHVLVHPNAAASHGQPIRDPNTALLLVTAQRESRATRWVMVECLSRGVLPVVLPPCASSLRALILCGNIKLQLVVKFETDPFRGVSLAREVPATAGRRLLLVGVDTCHTKSISVGSVVGLVVAPQRHHILPIFWTHSVRGREVQQVAQHFRTILAEAVTLYDGLDEVVIMQDGDVFSELSGMKAEIQASVANCGLTFMCLHKRTNVRFMHDGRGGSELQPPSQQQAPFNNIVKGTVIPALTPVALDYEAAAPSFYLQTHETSMSTARIVQYTVHHVSPTFDITDVCQLANVMANVLATQPTKLPMPTRCAHRLADYAERLIDAVPQFQHHYIPQPLRQRLWYL